MPRRGPWTRCPPRYGTAWRRPATRARAFSATARTKDQPALIAGVLGDTETIDGPAVDTALRWSLLELLQVASGAPARAAAGAQRSVKPPSQSCSRLSGPDHRASWRAARASARWAARGLRE